MRWLSKLFISLVIIFQISCTPDFLSNKAPLSETLSVSSVFSDNMVLQRDEDIPIWGWADPGSKVGIDFMGKSYVSISNDTGKWMVYLKKQTAGGPYDLSIFSKDTIHLSNILIGDVWLCSGQSNMNMPLAGWGRVQGYKETTKEARNPKIRVFTANRSEAKYAYHPEDDIRTDTGWEEANPENAGHFTAVGYHFALELSKHIDVPIGILHSSNGGTPVESWMREENLKQFPEFDEAVAKLKASDRKKEAKAEKKYSKAKNAWYDLSATIDPGMSEGWFRPDYNIDSWSVMNLLPGFWTEHDLPGFKGVVWYKKRLNLPESWANVSATISLAQIYERNILYINGIEVGRIASSSSLNQYKIPYGILKAGENDITVRISANRTNGGIRGLSEDLILQNGDEIISLTGEWAYKAGVNFKDIKQKKPKSAALKRRPTVNYNALIHPILPYGIKGVLWYQGESNTKNAYAYRDYFKAMISDWRQLFNKAELPFYYVQIANYMDKHEQPVTSSSWAVIRESQTKALELNNTGQVIILDIGETYDIHPKNKKEVARRLSLLALKNEYGVDIQAEGPTIESVTFSEDKALVVLNFSGRLKTVDGEAPTGFLLAGEDQVFYRANARLSNSKIELQSDKVANPVAIRYAWEDNPDINLTDDTMMPLSPYRSDTWLLPTQKIENKTSQNNLYFIDSKDLADIREKIQTQPYKSALNKLINYAENALKSKPYSVMDKMKTPPSGDKHDYTSMSPYWWPDPNKKDGLPYIRRDGEVNPERAQYDKYPGADMAHESIALALAYYYTGNDKYAKKAAELLKVWFLNPETRMNPNLNYGQFIPGKIEGRSTGIIESRNFVYTLDAVSLIEKSPYWTDEDSKQYKQWMNDFLGWLTTSKLGIEEGNRPNNHGSWYGVQVSALALYCEKPDILEIRLKDMAKRRNIQFEDDGAQPEELARTKSFNYSVFNIRAHFEAVKLTEKTQFKNLTEGHSLDKLIKAVDFLIPYINQTKDWEYKQISSTNGAEEEMIMVLSYLYKKTNESKYSDLLKSLSKRFPDSQLLLLYQ